MSERPSEKLAAQILKRLVKEKLISNDSAAKMKEKLADGNLRAEDWRLPIELGTESNRKK